ncbi:hypothetical protein V8C86DRAFT_2973836 [Haematococcus lacustris]
MMWLTPLKPSAVRLLGWLVWNTRCSCRTLPCSCQPNTTRLSFNVDGGLSRQLSRVARGGPRKRRRLTQATQATAVFLHRPGLVAG